MKVAAGELPVEYFINGDSAYVLSNQMIVPCGSAEFSDFDFQQSSNRICIEFKRRISGRHAPWPYQCYPRGRSCKTSKKAIASQQAS